MKKITMFKYWVFFPLAVLFFGMAHSDDKSRQKFLKEDGKAFYEKCVCIASQFYHLEEGEELKEITQAILDNSETKNSIKQTIIATGRRFFLFIYPSDGYKIKGMISFVPNPHENNLLVFLRGGTGIFGLQHPATDCTCVRDYTVIATTYRGGVSEGVDQYGGEDVHDVENLLLFLPTLSEKLKVPFYPKNTYMLGVGRGGMEMFLALGKSPFLQQKVTKVVSFSGLLDIEECILDRKDMKKMFIQEFGLIPGKNEETWMHLRNPINTVSSLRNDLSFLIIQGTNDLRSSLQEGYHMVEKLQANGNPVEYVEIPGGDHCLHNQPNRMELITDWFEK